ncbi:MAG: hypothetical protein H6981_03815 [Gammaproteobacteria bacterium]|nr:hypothetical protein [Gammaproteobacteria bacterium]
MKIEELLANSFPQEIVEHILSSYLEVEKGYRLEKWKPSELDAGHFVEAVRRLIEHALFNSYTPFSTSLGSFNQGVLNRYESSTGDESFRILIPRTLYAMYCVRNKRGVGHISSISPNKMDASFILSSTKWVLAELIRIAGASSPDEAERLVSQVTEKQVDLVWDDGESFMILSKKLKASEKVLIALYKEDKIDLEVLRIRVEYKNKSNFKKILLALKKDKLIDINDAGICKLSPLGVVSAEAIVNGT